MIENLHPVVLAGLAVLLLLNIVATVALFRDHGVTPLQRAAQTLFIWLLPVAGGLVILFLVGSHHTREEMRSMVPFPFYLASAAPQRDNSNRDEFGSGDHPLEGGGGEGSCGSD